MARNNRPRSIGGERNLAERIRRQRALVGWSPSDLARAMTNAGCSIATSAIYRIEDDENPRKISVDELITLAQVFDTTVESLLTPVEVLDKEKAQETLKQLDDAQARMIEAIGDTLTGVSTMLDLAVFEPELYEYVSNHWFGGNGVPDEDLDNLEILSVVDDEGQERSVHSPRLNRAIRELYNAIYELGIEIGGERVEESVRRGFIPQIEDDNGQH